MGHKTTITNWVRNLRRDETESEKIAWDLFRNRRFMDLKIVRQKPIIYETTKEGHRFFVLDFYCHKLKLGIEFDGTIHEFRKDYDDNRDSILRELGIAVFRFPNLVLIEPERFLGLLEKMIREGF